MESALLGVVLDSSVLVAAERKNATTPEVIRSIRQTIGDVPIVICALTVAELGHGIYRADTPQRAQQRRQFLEELKAHIPISCDRNHG
jgi:predicted nucleic acid-binding protein